MAVDFVSLSERVRVQFAKPKYEFLQGIALENYYYMTLI
jgi:hypothetical protein